MGKPRVSAAYTMSEPMTKPRVSEAYTMSEPMTGAWNPTKQQKYNVASDTWKAYKGNGADGSWMGNGDNNNPYQIRGVKEAGSDNGMVDFFWRKAGDTGAGQQYGSLSGMAWNDPSHPDWLQAESSNFWDSAKAQFGDFWGQRRNWDPATAQPPSTVQPPTAITPPPVTPAAPPGAYTPPSPVIPSTGEDVTNYGLGAGKQLLEQAMGGTRTMPEWWGNNYRYQDPAGWADKYPGQVQNPGLNFNNIPGEYQGQNYNQGPEYQVQNYQGLMNGDYNRLETALRQPGEIAARDAYNTGSKNLKNTMGYRGMYGSSVMGQQANQGLNREFINANAANAANATAQRYGLQQGDQQFGASLNQADRQYGFGQSQQDRQYGNNANTQDRQFGANYGLQRADLDRQNTLDQWKAGVTDAGLQRDYNNQRFMFDYTNSESARQEANALGKSKYDYALQSDAWNQMNNENLFNQAMALAGRGAPLSTAAMNYQNQQNAADRNDNAAMWSLGTNLVGGLFGFGQDGGWGDSFINSLWS